MSNVVPHQATDQNYKFNTFIQEYVIPTFCHQREKEKQFAVLFLSKHKMCNIQQTQFGRLTMYSTQEYVLYDVSNYCYFVYCIQILTASTVRGQLLIGNNLTIQDMCADIWEII